MTKPVQRCGTAPSQSGETLVSLLVGLGLGLLVLAAGAHMFAQLLRGQRLSLQDSHLQQDLHFALDLVASELADAQYSGKAWLSRSPNVCTDDFCDGREDFELGNARLDWTLDRNHNGLQDNNECSGLRLRSGALQLRTSCSPEVWTALTDIRSLNLTQLRASLQCIPDGGWLHRQVLIEVQASWPQQPDRLIKLQRQVVLRNPLPQVTENLYCP